MKAFYPAVLFALQVLWTFGCTNSNQSVSTMKNDDVLYHNAALKADSLLSVMTLEEKVTLMGGVDFFYSQAIPRLGIHRVMMTDATGGVHLRESFEGVKYTNAINQSTSFPAPIALAATWNKELAHRYAQSIGEECRAAGIGVLLGPGMNIYRISQCGRNFEYFGEDPFLAGRMIENYVKGVQGTGTIATLKHFVANNTDFFRRKSNSIVDERTLHEIYLPAFKSGIDAGAKAVMTSYNLLNGEWCGQSDDVINQLLRKDLGFKWMVMTDWWSVYDGQKVIRSGQNIEMPSAQSTSLVMDWISEGTVTESQIDSMIRPQLITFLAMNSFAITPDTSLIQKFSEHESIALETARQSIVLLKNRNGLLPIQSGQKILACGFYLDQILQGGGSAEVAGYHHVTLRQALSDEFGDRVTFIEYPAEDEVKNADVVVLSVGTQDCEGYDRPFELPGDMEDFIKRTVNLNANTVVVVNSGSGINMVGWSELAGAILYGWYPGQNGNLALAEVLSGKTNPSGKLPMTIERSFDQTPGFGYMNNEPFYVGWNSEGERAHPVYDLKYHEGVLVGYRWFDAKQIEPLFPFGFGLSYTEFKYSGFKLSSASIEQGNPVTAQVTITNIGDKQGSEIVQFYIQDESCKVIRPVKELKGFERVSLNPGESKVVNVMFQPADFAFYDDSIHQWSVEPGRFNIMVGSSSRQIHATEGLTIE